MSNDHLNPSELRRLVEGGWQKPVKPPSAQMRRGGLPPASTYQQQANPTPSRPGKENSDDE